MIFRPDGALRYNLANCVFPLLQETKTESDWEAGRMFQDFARAMDPALAMPIRRSRNPALTWEQAMQETLKLHPDKTIITKLKDVTCEEDLDPVLMTSTVFLARLARPHPYVFRNAWYLEVSLIWSSIS